MANNKSEVTKMYGMNDTETALYKASYDLHRIFYETAEESRDADFWRQIQDGLSALGKFNSQGTILQILIHDVLTAYGHYGNTERLRANMEREKVLEREREKTAKEEARAKQLAEVERLERELAQARAAVNNSDTYARLDRIAAELSDEITARGLDDSNGPVSDSALMAFTLLAAAVGIAACGADYFTDEEAAEFEQMAGKIISMCDAGL